MFLIVAAMPLTLNRYLPPLSQYSFSRREEKALETRPYIQERVLIEKKSKKRNSKLVLVQMKYNEHLIQPALSNRCFQ